VRLIACALFLFLAYGCASTTAPATQPKPEALRGVASWYGEEFAGRTTANGEIFDPTLMTAAHRTLPFGTVLDVTNPKTNQSVRVRVNDRGPYIGGRVIDLSYAAAQKIGLVEPGIGEVNIHVVKLGSGDREPPAPFDVTIAEAPATAPARTAGDPPPIAFPLPGQPAPAPATAPSAATTASEPVVVDGIEVQVQRGDVLTRRQVSVDGTTIEEVPVGPGEATTASSLDEQQRAPRRAEARRSTGTATNNAARQFIVQVGAFSVEANARALQERLTSLGHQASIDRGELFRVRIGPFATREQAVTARAALEANGLSAMIVNE
jgi:rare lipoprotein A